MYAVIDLGSNSFHLLIADTKQQQIRVVGRCSEKIQLAEGLDATGELSPAAMERGLQCLREFKKILEQFPIQQIKAVGTEALRRARNADFFRRQAKKIGFTIDIISGQQEASWIFHGVCGPLPDSNNTRLTVDIGGASTEIALGNDRVLQLTESIAIGCVSWRDQFFSPQLDYSANKAPAYFAVQERISILAAKIKSLRWDEVYASSGSAKMLATIGYANNWSQGNITRECINNIEQYLISAKTLDDIAIPGLKPQRLDLLAPGLIIMSVIMDVLEINEIFYSPTALREGILAELIQRRVDYQLKLDRFS